MATTLEERVALLERQVAELLSAQHRPKSGSSWLADVYGRFANDPIFDEAMKLGRKYRESTRPRRRKTKKRS
ncbi:MAG TPA: hypothetical protein VH370_19170 [Humisphaera sp.]|jgi:hypothetical protein|nr:hypothetical protein [Humisphaera sp.]